jgi:hypothetical protein
LLECTSKRGITMGKKNKSDTPWLRHTLKPDAPLDSSRCMSRCVPLLSCRQTPYSR